MQRWRIEFQHDTGIAQGSKPRGLFGLPVELGQTNQCHQARGQTGGVFLQSLAAVTSGFAGWDAQIDQLIAAEQRQIAGSQR